MDNVKDSMKSIIKESVTVGKGISNSMKTSPVDKLKSATESLKSKFKSATDETTKIGKAMDKLKQTKVMQSLSKGMGNVSKAVVKAKDKFQGMSGVLDRIKTSRIGEKVGTSLGKVRGPIDKVIAKSKTMGTALSGGMKKFGGYIKTAGQKLKGLQTKMGAVGKSLTMKLTMPLVAGATAGTKMYMDVSTGIKKVSTLADKGILPAKQIKKEAKQISDASGVAQTEVLDATYSALSAGVESSKVFDFVQSSIDLTKAGFTDMDTAIDATTTVMNAYGDKAFDVSKIHDIFVQTQDKGKISVDELGGVIGRVVPNASALGVNMDQLGASYAIMTSKGQNANIATTNLNSMLDEVGKTGSTSDKALRKMTGKSFKDLTKEGKSVGDILGILDKSAEKSGVSLKDMFSSSTAGSAALTLMSEGVDGYNSSLDDMNGATGKTAENAKTMEDEMFKIKKAFNSLKNVAIEVGGLIAPVVAKVATKVSGLVDKFNELDGGTKKVIGKIVLVVGAIGPLIWGLSKVIGIGPKLTSAIEGAGKAFKFMTSPAGIIIGVLAVLIFTVMHLWKTNEEFRDKVIEIWGSIQSALGTALEFIKQLWETHGESIKTTLSLVFETIQNIVLFAFDIIVSIVTIGVGIIKGIWGLFGDTIMMLASSAWETISGVVEGAMGIIQGIIDVVTGIITGNWEMTWSGLQSILEGATTIMSSLWSGLVDLLTAPVDALVNIINEKFLSGSEKVLEVWGKVKDFLKHPIKGTVSLISKGADKVKGFFGGSHKTGLNRVPYNDYPANLHKDEMVLTKSASAEYRAMGGTKDGLSSTDNDYSVSTTTITNNDKGKDTAPAQFNFNPTYNIEVKGNATEKEAGDLLSKVDKQTRKTVEKMFKEFILQMG